MKRPIIISLIFLMMLILLPLIVQGYWLRVLTNMFMYAILAESVNIIAGYAGYLALGNVVFFGTGAYLAAVLMAKVGLSMPVALFLAGLGCAAYAVIIGIPILRLNGRYFLMATIALLELTREIVTRLRITGGGMGINLPVFSGTPDFVYALFYYLMLGVLVLSVVTLWIVGRSRFGFGLRAIKFDEEAAAVMGVPTVRYKIAAWAISAFYTGLAGAVFANWMTFIEAPSVFSISMSIKMFLMYIFGGAGTLFGPIIGAFSIDLLSELIWEKYNDLHYLILGLVIIAVVVFIPQGLANLKPQFKMPSKFIGIKRRPAVQSPEDD
ncbi:branched-chain amino acid ABC transporter permease [Paradesulfitobacterium aromaticivorans]